LHLSECLLRVCESSAGNGGWSAGSLPLDAVVDVGVLLRWLIVLAIIKPTMKPSSRPIMAKRRLSRVIVS